MVAVVLTHIFIELISAYIIKHLRENIFSCIHNFTLKT